MLHLSRRLKVRVAGDAPASFSQKVASLVVDKLQYRDLHRVGTLHVGMVIEPIR